MLSFWEGIMLIGKFGVALGLLLLAPISGLPSFAQDPQTAAASELLGQLLEQYKPDTILTVRKAGITAYPPDSVVMGIPASKYENGQIHGANSLLSAMTYNAPQDLRVGEKVNPTKVEVDVKKETVSIWLTECDACNGVPQSSWKAKISFQFPKGYLEGADPGQVEDVIGQVLALDTGNIGGGQQAAAPAPPQAPQDVNPSQGLTNDDILKLAKAGLPDSVVIAKIKSSNCEFDTSADALIKLKGAGVSGPVLQAVVEATPPANAPPAVETAPAGPPDVGCGDYAACISKGIAAFQSAQWDGAIVAFQAALNLDPSRPDAWQAMCAAYFATSRSQEAARMCDKALAVGGRLKFRACHHRTWGSCEAGALVLDSKNVSFASAGGQQLFSVPPALVLSPEASRLHTLYDQVFLSMKVGDKEYRFQVMPDGVECQSRPNSNTLICPAQSIVQQLVVSNYISQAIPRLASGALGSSRP